MKKLIIAGVCVVMFVAGGALADWVPGDGHKMHFPQLPNPNGWDVDVTSGVVADDWKCSQTGPVSDIHFWISAENDNYGNGIDFIDVRIYDDVPAQGGDYSRPGNEKWFRRVEDPDDQGTGTKFTIRGPETGDQGWFTPPISWKKPDHQFYYQINIKDIQNPFDQVVENIYWLEIHIVTNAVGAGVDPPYFGWKTSLDHWNDDAVFEASDGSWAELYDPRSDHPNESLDMAFVITPEPATMTLLAIGFVALIGRRRI